MYDDKRSPSGIIIIKRPKKVKRNLKYICTKDTAAKNFM